MGKRTKNAVYIIACVVVTFSIFLLLTRFFQIVLVSTDDVIFENILSGDLTGSPDAHTYFLSFPLSFILSKLYSLNCMIHWYELVLLGCVYVCVFFVLLRGLSLSSLGLRFAYLIVSSVIIVIVFSSLLVHLEWTAVSGALCATAIFYYVFMAFSKQEGTWWEKMSIILLLFMSTCIRRQILLVYIPLVLLVFLVSGIKDKKSFKSLKCYIRDLANNKSGIGFVLVISSVYLSITLIHSLAYAGEEWQDYSSFTKDRSVLYDYSGFPDYETYAETYLEEGIGASAYNLIVNDYNLIVPFNATEEVPFSRLANISKENAHVSFTDDIKRISSLFLNLLTNRQVLFIHFLLLYLLCVCVFGSTKNEKMLFHLAGSIAWFLVLILYFGFRGRLPHRLLVALELGAVGSIGGILVLEISGRESLASYKQVSSLSMIVAIGVASFAIFIFGITSLRNCKEINKQEVELAQERKEITTYCRNHKDNIYLRDFVSFSQQGKLFQQFENYRNTNYISTGGWVYNSPIFEQMKANLQWNTLFDEIVEGDVYYLVRPNRTNAVMSRLNQFFIENRSAISVRLEGSFTTNRGNVDVLKFFEMQNEY